VEGFIDDTFHVTTGAVAAPTEGVITDEIRTTDRDTTNPLIIEQFIFSLNTRNVEPSRESEPYTVLAISIIGLSEASNLKSFLIETHCPAMPGHPS
jgi:hypothetical protein